MNILLVISSLALGGAEVFVVRLANQLSKRGNTVFLLDLNPTDRSPLLTERLVPGVTLLGFDTALSIGQKLKWKGIFSLAQLSTHWFTRAMYCRKKYDAKKLSSYLDRLVKLYHIQVINSHLATADWMVANYFADQQHKPKFIISMHGCYNQDETTMSRLKKRIRADKQGVLELADRIVLLTPKNAHPLRHFRLKNDPVYIPLGFEKPNERGTASQASKQNQPFTFGLVSRAVARKGWEEAIEATQLLHQDGINCRLLLVGGGPYQQQLKRRFGHLSYVQFVGATAQVLDWVNQIDVGLFPSYIESESFPNSIIEYLACEKPVIGTDIGEVKNMISTPSGQLAGMLLLYQPQGISVQEMARCMREYTQDDALLKKHKEVAAQAFEKFDMDRCVNAYERIYHE